MKKFGEIAIEQGYITQGQLRKALYKQNKSNHKLKLIGCILIDKGFINITQYEKIKELQQKDNDLRNCEFQGIAILRKPT